MVSDLLMAIDSGTQSVKAMIFDGAGQMLHRQQVAFAPYRSPRPGWAEQDPEQYWQKLCLACQRLWAQPGLDRSRIAAVALTTQRGTVVCLDRAGRPLRPAILWLDQRKAQRMPPLGGPWGLLFRMIGLRGTIAYFQAEAEANWICTHQPEIWRQTHKFLLLSGYLTHRLTGKYVDSVGCQVGYLPFDYRRQRWARSWDWKWRCLTIRPQMLPELVAPTGILGEISAQAAAATGLPIGLPLVAAGADRACDVLGAGGTQAHIGCVTYGTTATINTTQRRYVEPIALLPAYPAALPGAYSLEVQVFRGYWMLRWFKEQFAPEETRKAAKQGVATEVLLERLLDDIAPGAMGLMLQPYWTPGLKSPGPSAKGAVIGFGDVHTRGHLYAAIIEGLAYAMRAGKERIEKRSGRAITELRVSGGGSQSDGAMQITADVFGMPAARPHVYETSGLGAAIDAAVGMGMYADVKTAAGHMTHPGRVFEPRKDAAGIYDALYRQVYCQMYRQLKPLYERIRTITGYPEPVN